MPPSCTYKLKQRRCVYVYNCVCSYISTFSVGCHLDMHGLRIDVCSSDCTKHSRVRFFPAVVASLRRAALQCEVAVCRLYECVLAQAVESVLEAVQCADVWVSVEPTCASET